jgi:D-alanyl-lipoteichoic acid biosynthesis protein DltD
MKQVIIAYLIPVILSIIVIGYIAQNDSFNSAVFKKNAVTDEIRSETNFIENFSSNKAYEATFLKNRGDAETIYLLGSSELTAPTDAIPYNFISRHFTTQVMGIGHAGNQCFSIYSQLLANASLLRNAPIVIILSPGWFESKPSKGTASEIFLEFNSENFLNTILKNKNDTEFRAYEYKRIAQLFNEFNSPNLELRLMNFEARASRSFIHRTVYSPVLLCDRFLLKMREQMSPLPESNDSLYERVRIVQTPVSFNWDSIYMTSKMEVMKRSTNNTWGIADDYYSEYINGKTGHMEPVAEQYNQELEDARMLIKLLKAKQVHASFIISPLNPFYYKNLKTIAPTIQIIEKEIEANHFPYLNLFETDTLHYEKAILHDVMHLSDYGWYKVDRFMIDTYHLSK